MFSGIFFASLGFLFRASRWEYFILCGFVRVMLCLRTFESITATLLVIIMVEFFGQLSVSSILFVLSSCFPLLKLEYS